MGSQRGRGYCLEVTEGEELKFRGEDFKFRGEELMLRGGGVKVHGSQRGRS